MVGRQIKHGAKVGDDRFNLVGTQRSGAKQKPAEAGYMEEQEDLRCDTEPRLASRAAFSFGPPTMNGEQQPVKEAPKEEGCAGAVPQTAEQHCNHQVAIGLEVAPAISPQRNIQIIPEPGGKADVPMTPEGRGVGD